VSIRNFITIKLENDQTASLHHTNCIDNNYTWQITGFVAGINGKVE